MTSNQAPDDLAGAGVRKQRLDPVIHRGPGVHERQRAGHLLLASALPESALQGGLPIPAGDPDVYVRTRRDQRLHAVDG